MKWCTGAAFATGQTKLVRLSTHAANMFRAIFLKHTSLPARQRRRMLIVMTHEALVTAVYLASVGMVVAALRARYRMGPNYSINRVRLIAVLFGLVGLGTIAIAVLEIANSDRSAIAILRLLAGVQFVLAAALFWYAATHRPAIRHEGVRNGPA
jgi:hypothetical protein